LRKHDIQRIIKRDLISTVYQPLIDLRTGQIIGYEALVRGPTGPYHIPQNLFQAAARANLLNEMEMACFKKITGTAHYLSGLVSINFSPSTVIACHKEILSKTRNLGSRVVLELTEFGLQDKDRDNLVLITQELKNLGVKIALDDIGAGDRDFSNICEIPVDYLKIDRIFICGITKPDKTAFRYAAGLNMLVKLAGQLGAQVIAEGVETRTQLAGVKRAGIYLVQGFYFSKPKPVKYWIRQEGSVSYLENLDYS